MSDGTEFEVDMSGNLGPVAKRFAAELALMSARLKEAERALSRAEHASKGLSGSLSSKQSKQLSEHSATVDRLRRSHLAGAPAMRSFGYALRGFGVHGSTLRKFTVDAAKTEVALRRLYRVSGGGFRGAATVTRAIASRAWNGGLREKAGSALWAGAKGAAGMAIGGTALAAGGAAFGGGMLGWNMASTAIEAERVKFALNSITEGQGDKWWAQSADYAKRFGLNINGVAENLMQMKASGFSDEMTNTLFLRMGDLRALGATEETIGRALLAIRQVQAAGRLQGDELNQLSEAGINANFIYAQLAKTMHKTIPEIIKLKEAGKLTSDIVIPAIAEAIGTKTGGKAAGVVGEQVASGTVSGLWGKLKGSWSVASTKALGDDSLAPLKRSLVDFTSWIEGPGGNKTIGAFGGMLSRVFAAAPAIIDKVIWLLETGLPGAASGFVAGLESSGAGKAINGITSALGDMGGPNGERATAALRQLGQDAGNLAGSVATLCGWLMKLVAWLGDVATWYEIVKRASQVTPLGQVSLYNEGVSWLVDKVTGDSGGQSTPRDTAGPVLGRTSKLGSDVDLGLGSDRMYQPIPTLDTTVSPRVSKAANISNTWSPTINQTVNVTASETDGMTPGEIGDVVGDRSERRLTESFRQVAYSNG